eukprot:RCo004065
MASRSVLAFPLRRFLQPPMRRFSVLATSPLSAWQRAALLCLNQNDQAPLSVVETARQLGKHSGKVAGDVQVVRNLAHRVTLLLTAGLEVPAALWDTLLDGCVRHFWPVQDCVALLQTMEGLGVLHSKAASLTLTTAMRKQAAYAPVVLLLSRKCSPVAMEELRRWKLRESDLRAFVSTLWKHCEDRRKEGQSEDLSETVLLGAFCHSARFRLW